MKVTSSIDDYQLLVGSSNFGDFFQSRVFYEILKEIGWNPHVLAVMEDNECVGGVLAYLLHNVDLPKRFSYMAVVKMGPIAQNPESLNVLMDSLEQKIKKIRVTFINIFSPFPCYHEVFYRKSYVMQHTGGEYSVIIDLNNSIDKLWSDLNKGCRRRVKKGLKMGVKVEEVGSEEQLMGFYRVYLDTSRRRRFLPYPYRFFKEMWKQSLKHKIVQFLIAVYNEKVIAGRINTIYSGKVATFISASIKQYWNLHPNHLLTWSSICHSKEENARVFSIEHLPKKKEPDRKIDYYTFKTSFGGKIVRKFIFYCKIFFPLRYHAQSAITKLLRPTLTSMRASKIL